MKNLICRSILVSLISTLTTHAGLKSNEFVNPPDDCRPMTWMHMMNGNASKVGLEKDLQALSDAGVGGALIFSVEKPEIADGFRKFNSPEFRDLLVHGVKEADRLGLTIGLHNCDGWSSSGGPWVKPEDAMKKLVWSEAVVKGGTISIALRPHANRLGFYRDVAVVAYPVPESELTDFKIPFTLSGSAPNRDFARLKDGDLDTMVTLTAAKGKMPFLQWHYEQPFCARSICIEHSTAPGTATLFASNDGKDFERVAELSEFRPSKTKRAFIGSFAAVTASYFKVEFKRPMPIVAAKLNSFAQFPDWLVHSCMAKGTTNLSGMKHPDDVPEVNHSDVKVLEASALSGNQLTTRLPEGTWRVMRFGYTLTGEKNQPATDAGRGLECDKLNAEALDKHFAAYVGKVAEQCGDLTGRTFQSAEIDSYEMGWQNWTDGFEHLFAERKGYDLTPYLPLIAGRFVGDLDTADAVLADFKDVVASLMAENYFIRFAQLCQQHGLQSYIEPYGNGPLNGLTIGGNCDIPMGEFWMNHIAGQLDVPVHAAHTYGKRVISAESFTQRKALNWKVHPWLMKPSGDTAWAVGINEFMFHRYVHQANTHVVPGMTMGSVGSHIDGTQTWWMNAGKAWMKYNQRGQFLLRQGYPVADLLVYAGDRAPQTAISNSTVGLPPGYNMDSCDAFVLHERVKVENSRMVLPEGNAYSVLMLAKCDRMHLKTLQRVAELAEAGITVVGPKPTGPLSLMDRKEHATAFVALADRLWGDGAKPQSVGKGWVIPGKTWPTECFVDKIEPDLRIAELEAFRFIHRKVGTDDLYFIHNPNGDAVTFNCSFRIADRIPEFWDADTGRMERTAQFRNVAGRTECPIQLDPFGSVFVMFRSASKGIDPVAKITPEGARVILDSNDNMQLVADAAGNYEIKRASGKTAIVKVADLQAPLAINGSWRVEFDGLGLTGDKVIDFNSLSDWKDHPRDDIKYFSGTAAYCTMLDLPAGWLEKGERIYLDLGRVEIAAEVILNGQNAGILWKPPFVIDVTDQVVEGKNKLEVRVTNLWANRLIGDETLKDTSGYAIEPDEKMPQWYVNNEPMPEGPRSTFTTFNFYTKDKELQPSGLLGPVMLKQEKVQRLTSF